MKTIKQIKKKIKKGKSKGNKQTKVITFKRKDFKKKLSTEVGFGFQDLKKDPRTLISTMICKGYNLSFIPKGDPKDMVIKVMVKH